MPKILNSLSVVRDHARKFINDKDAISLSVTSKNARQIGKDMVKKVQVDSLQGTSLVTLEQKLTTYTRAETVGLTLHYPGRILLINRRLDWLISALNIIRTRGNSVRNLEITIRDMNEPEDIIFFNLADHLGPQLCGQIESMTICLTAPIEDNHNHYNELKYRPTSLKLDFLSKMPKLRDLQLYNVDISYTKDFNGVLSRVLLSNCKNSESISKLLAGNKNTLNSIQFRNSKDDIKSLIPSSMPKVSTVVVASCKTTLSTVLKTCPALKTLVLGKTSVILKSSEVIPSTIRVLVDDCHIMDVTSNHQVFEVSYGEFEIRKASTYTVTAHPKKRFEAEIKALTWNSDFDSLEPRRFY